MSNLACNLVATAHEHEDRPAVRRLDEYVCPIGAISPRRGWPATCRLTASSQAIRSGWYFRTSHAQCCSTGALLSARWSCP